MKFLNVITEHKYSLFDTVFIGALAVIFSDVVVPAMKMGDYIPVLFWLIGNLTFSFISYSLESIVKRKKDENCNSRTSG